MPKGETMFNRKKHHDTSTSDTHVVKGAGLARGPALLLGTILAAAGLVLFLHAGDTPTGGFPDADARGEKFLGFESNGWTAFFTTTAGVVLLFAAAQHLLAKLLGLGVGLALAACVVLDLVNGPGVLGLAAANWAVDLGWGIAAVLLLLNVFAPRITHEEPAAPRHGRLHDDTATRRAGTARPVAAAAAAGTPDRRHDGEHRHDGDHGLVGDHRHENDRGLVGDHRHENDHGLVGEHRHEGDHGVDGEQRHDGDQRHVDGRTGAGTVADPLGRRDGTDGPVPHDPARRDADAPASAGSTRIER